MYRQERINENNLKDLIELYKVSFGKVVSLDFLKAKFDTSKFGASYIGYIAYEESSNEPAGYYGVFPMLIKNNAGEKIVAQSGDTMTSPKHQGKGLFTTLAGMTYQLAKSEGIELVWGIPNKNSYPGFIKKLNWKDQEPLIKYQIPVSTVPLSKIFHRLNVNWLNKLYFKYCQIVLKGATNDIFENTKSTDTYQIKKDKNFYEYKNYNPNRFILHNQANQIWVKLESTLLIGDVSFTDMNSFYSFLRNLKSQCMFAGIPEITFICNSKYSKSMWFQKFEKVKQTESLPYCFLGDWNDELAADLSICLADLDTF